MINLEDFKEPADLRAVPAEQLPALAERLRAFLVDSVCRTGGHLGPNLGVVELTIALHRAFDSPRDTLLWDVGHQAYVHKILTGRAGAFGTLRQRGGISGYPSRAESAHDHIEHSHASAALSYADGLAKARELTGSPAGRIVAVVGDGALTGGMSWEALNNIAAAPHRPVVIVVNDNGRSYAPTVGGLANRLAALRTHSGYERVLERGRELLSDAGPVGSAAYRALHAVKLGLKDLASPQGMFSDLGLKYLGPVDGHDVEALENALRLAASFDAPVIVHCITRKGAGYQPAELDDEENLHGIGVTDPQTGAPVGAGGLTWSRAFGEELIARAEQNPDVVAITAAMPGSVGLTEFARRHPDRFFDVGIAEQHAIGSAAGLAMAGLHPVVALYSTFLHRAFDQVLMDVGLHRLPVTLVLDRAGATGDDGPSHNGLWDLSLLRLVPHLRIAAPRDHPTLRQELGEALACDDGPTALRYPRGKVGQDIEAVGRIGEIDVLHDNPEAGILIVAVGAMAGIALDAAALCAEHGLTACVVDPRWIKPVPAELTDLATRFPVVGVIEDGIRDGALASVLAQQMHERGAASRVHGFGITDGFPEQGTRAEVLGDAGLTPRHIARVLLRAAQGESDAASALADRSLA